MLRDPETNSNESQTRTNAVPSQDAANAGPSQNLRITAKPELMGQWIDLMPLVRTDWAVQGEWLLAAGALHVKAKEGARLVLPYRPPAEYDFEIAFARKSGRYSIAMIFPAGAGQATFEVDAWGMNLAGIQNIGSRTLQDRKEPVARLEIANGTRHVMLLKVRSQEVQAYLDGKPVAKYHGDGSDLSLLPVWDLRDRSALGLGAFDAMTTFYQIRIRPVSHSRR
jgi:hypothetical protein